MIHVKIGLEKPEDSTVLGLCVCLRFDDFKIVWACDSAVGRLLRREGFAKVATCLVSIQRLWTRRVPVTSGGRE